jgi:hypothetical protein
VHPRLTAITLSACLLTAASFPGAAGATGASIAAHAEPTEISYGSPLTVSGQISEAGTPLSGVALELQAAPFPYRAYVTVASAVSEAGSFHFAGVLLGENARLRVLATTPRAASPAFDVVVDTLASVSSRNLGPGRERLSVRIRHDPSLHSPPVPVWWYLAPHGSSRFKLAAVNTSGALGAGVLYATVTVDPPSERFRWRVCLNPPWEEAMGPPSAHGPCPRHDFTLRDAP